MSFSQYFMVVMPNFPVDLLDALDHTGVTIFLHDSCIACFAHVLCQVGV